MADIGITYSSNPSRLIQASGEFLSNNIRDIGRSVQSTILEINTKKDLARFAQNLQQNVNPNSDDFAQQAVQVAASHPLAIQDPRGQIALNILGKAHGEYQQAKLAVQRQGVTGFAPGIGIYNKGSGQVIQAAPQKPLVVPARSRAVDANGNVIVEPLPEPDAFVSTPGGVMNKRTGTDPQGNPIVIPEKGALTESQRLNAARMARKDRADLIKSEITEIDKNFTSAEANYNKLKAAEDKLAKEIRETKKEDVRAQLEDSRKKHEEQKTFVGKLADELRAKKEQRLKDLKAIEAESDSIGLPPVGPDAAAPIPSSGKQDRVPVIDPNGVAGFLPANQVEAALQNGYKRR